MSLKTHELLDREIYSVKLAGSDRQPALMRFVVQYSSYKTKFYYWEQIDTLETFDYHNYDVVERSNMVCQERELIHGETYLVKGDTGNFLKLKCSRYKSEIFWTLDGINGITTHSRCHFKTDVIYHLPKEKFSLKINSIKIIIGCGPDYLLLKTNLPQGCWPYEGQASMRLEVAANKGVEYCEKNFSGIPVEVIKV